MIFSFFVSLARLFPDPARQPVLGGILLVLALLMLPHPAMAEGNGLITVGVFQVEPIIFVDEGGRPQGLFVDVIEQIAEKEGWQLKYVPGTWSEGFQRMRSGEIDLMTAVAYTPERDQYLDYGQESVLTLWGQVFVKQGVALQNILDLDGQAVAIMEGDINGRNFLETAAKFEISCQAHEYPSLAAVFQAVADGKVAAGVAPNIFGYRHAGQYGLVGTAVIFSPVSAYFASAAGSNDHLLTRIDQYLATWKGDKESFYYRRLDHWFGGDQFERPLPFWFFAALCLVILVAVMLALWSRSLRGRVAEKSKELRRSEENYKQLVENSNSIILRWDVNGHVTFLNEFGQKFFGYLLDEIVGRHVVGTIVAESDRSGKNLKAMIQGILSRPEEYLLNENENMCKDGARVWIQWSNKPITDDNGQLLEILSVGFDITKLNRAEREKLENEQRYRLLFDSASDAILIMKNYVFWDCNSKTMEVFGCTMADIIDATPALFSPPSQPDGRPSPEAARVYIDAAMAGENQFFSWRHQRLDGTPFDAEISLNRILVDDEVYIQAIVRDVSEQRRLESELRQAQKMEAIGTLAGGIAHDFNNILTSIFGFTELAHIHRQVPDKLERDLSEVTRAAERAKDLVQQILTFSRKSDQEKRPLQVSLIAKEALKMMRSTIPSTIEIRQDIASEAMVHADPVQIHQIVMNLCTNAYHAMRDKGGTMTVSLCEVDRRGRGHGDRHELPAGHYLLLAVRDTGHGISTDLIGKIFEPYFTTKRVGEGTGLGLALVHGIVKSHKGWINVTSQPGQGTCFEVYLPVIDQDHDLPAVANTVTPQASAYSGRIMLVDDEENIRAVGKEVLEGYGYQVTTFADPGQALETFQSGPDSYDLLVTDMTMPAMNGAELARQVLAIRSDFPVILCTGYSENINRESALAMGITEYVAKPISMSNLADAIHTILEAKR